MKSEFKRVKEEITEAAHRVTIAEEERQRQEDRSRKQYESAKIEMNAALVAGDKDGYKAAGIKAEEARLELDFFEKRRETEQKAKATKEDDVRIQAALNSEAKRITAELYNKLIPILNEASIVSREAKRNLDDINSSYDSWKQRVMKERIYSPIGRNYMIGISSIINNIGANMVQFEEQKKRLL